jgi:hypothetical protein
MEVVIARTAGLDSERRTHTVQRRFRTSDHCSSRDESLVEATPTAKPNTQGADQFRPRRARASKDVAGSCMPTPAGSAPAKVGPLIVPVDTCNHADGDIGYLAARLAQWLVDVALSSDTVEPDQQAA